ncbi:DUF397 domain-containing protein [Streptomyces silvensis]|uniref:DUF397 domain-containing protein n=1 Tax=Streptomyces silvensis TaxID=1765722 RepID=A0A0W7X4Z8_9ACTN|nr:DUF397 domain-containing protein [Streptomyces silvensis]KUF17779.1 DUF397 domain-containing protein [Streptomyces silvensis]
MTLEWIKSSYSTADGPSCVEMAWRKSSYSTADGPECVEVGWRKSSHSTGDGPECVEVAPTPSTVHIRDSKNPDGPRLTLTPAAWADFIARHAK